MLAVWGLAGLGPAAFPLKKVSKAPPVFLSNLKGYVQESRFLNFNEIRIKQRFDTSDDIRYQRNSTYWNS